MSIRRVLALCGVLACGRDGFDPRRDSIGDGVTADIDATPCTLGPFGAPVRLPGAINSSVDDWTPFVAPSDLSLLFYSQRLSVPGEPDIWISTPWPSRAHRRCRRTSWRSSSSPIAAVAREPMTSGTRRVRVARCRSRSPRIQRTSTRPGTSGDSRCLLTVVASITRSTRRCRAEMPISGSQHEDASRRHANAATMHAWE